MRRLACFLDGTWNNADTESVVTNVVKLCESVADHDASGIIQLAHYVTGIDSEKGLKSKFLKGAVGLGVGHRIKKGYFWLMKTYQPGDEIYLFGFSRGAFEARSLGGFITLFGIAKEEPAVATGRPWLDRAWDVYRQRPEKRDPAELESLRAAAHYPVGIKCLGVWDTVGNIGNPFFSGTLLGRRLNFHDTRLHPTIEVALHALSVDEVRGPFRPTLFTLPEGQSLAPNQIVEQVWFPGVHADVGGGFTESRLSDISLEWMMDRVTKTTGLTFDRAKLDRWTRQRVHVATKVPLAEIPKTPSIRPSALAVQHSSAANMLFWISYLFPFIRLIKQNEGAIPNWRSKLIGAWRSGRLPDGVVSINEEIHESLGQRFGRRVIEMRGNNSHIITYEPKNLAALVPDVWKPAQLPAAPDAAAPPDAPKRVKIFAVHGTFAHEADWDNWDEDDVFTSRIYPNQSTTPAEGISPTEQVFDNVGDDEKVKPQRHFINRLSEQLWKDGITFSPGDHTQFNWSGGNSHDERRTAAVGLKKAIQANMKDKQDYYNGGFFVIGHSHGGTISRLAMNMWDRDFDSYKPLHAASALTKHDGFKLDDDCPNCKQERNGRVGPNDVPMPAAVITLGSPFVTFEPRNGGLLAAKIGVWVWRFVALFPLLGLLAFFFFMQKFSNKGPLEIMGNVQALGIPWVQTMLLLAWPLAAYWLLMRYIPKRVLHTIAHGHGRRTTRYAVAALASNAFMIGGIVGLLAYYWKYMSFFESVAGPMLGIPGKTGPAFFSTTILGSPTTQSWLIWVIPVVLYWLLAVNLPSRILSYLNAKVAQLKDELPKKYDPREASPVTYASYTTAGDEPAIGLSAFGFLTWVIQSLSLSAACVLGFGILLLLFVGISLLENTVGGGHSTIGKFAISALDGNPDHQKNLINLMNWLTAFPGAVWHGASRIADWTGLSTIVDWAQYIGPGWSGSDPSKFRLDPVVDLAAVKHIPQALALAVATIFATTLILGIPALLSFYLLNSYMRSSMIGFGSEPLAWSIANKIAIARRANSDTMVRKVPITWQAWRKGQIAHCYYYNNEETTNDIADYIAGKIKHNSEPSWPIMSWVAAIARWLIVLLFILSIFVAAVGTVKKWEAEKNTPASQSAVAHPGGQPLLDCGDGCPVMVTIPAGEFMMGLPPDDHYQIARAPRKVVIPKPFAMSKTEVTFTAWDACVAAGGCNGYQPSDSGGGRGSRPVINVDWNHAKAYAKWLSAKTGKSYRLPSEAEWEYAARAGTVTKYHWGNSIDKGNANCADCGSPWQKTTTAPVASFKANAFGLHDMHGNVAEWVEDTWHADTTGAPSDGSAWRDGGDPAQRIIRGGAWNINGASMHAGLPVPRPLVEVTPMVGFRVVRDLGPNEP